MNSWRNKVTEHSQNELDKLYEEGIQAAEYLLKMNNEIYPFALSIGKNDKINFINIQFNEKTSSDDIIIELITKIKNDKLKFKAIAIIVDVKINEGKNDALKISLEHSEGISIEIFIPYKIKGKIKKEIQFDEANAFSTEPFIWIV